MLSNQINFLNDDFTQAFLQNSLSESEFMSSNLPTPFDVYINNNTNMYSITSPTQNMQNNNVTLSHPLSHVKVSPPNLDENVFTLDPLEHFAMDPEMLRALEEVTLSISNPSSPESVFAPPTDDMMKTEPQPAPQTTWPVPQYPRKLASPVPLGELPQLVAFPEASKKLSYREAELATLCYPFLFQKQQPQYQQTQHQPQYQQPQHQHPAYDINLMMHQMKIQKTQSYDEGKFHRAACLEQQFHPYTYDDCVIQQPRILHKVRSNEDHPTPEAINNPIKKAKRRISRRSSCSDITKNHTRPRSNSLPVRSRPRAPSITVIRDPHVEAILANHDLNPQIPVESQFRLLHEPNPQQRKSYQNENRYLAPSPLIVMARVPEAIAGGMVTVQAVHAGDCTDFPKNVLGESETFQNLDEGGKAHFVMKCAETTGNQQVRLKFVVRYVANETLFEETIYSQPFYISSHTGKRTDLLI